MPRPKPTAKKETKTVEKNTKTANDITFFGAVDRKHNMKEADIVSSYPAWYFTRQIEQMQNDIDSMENMLEWGQVPEESKPQHRAEIAQHKKRLDSIMESRPKLTSAQRSELSKVIAELETKILAAKFTYDEMRHGAASPHDEVKRQMQPCVPIRRDIAEALNLRIDKKGLVSRNEAEKAWKILLKARDPEARTHTGILEHKKNTCRTSRVEAFVPEVRPSIDENFEMIAERAIEEMSGTNVPSDGTL